MPFPVAAIPAIVAGIQTAGSMISQSMQRKAEQRAYDRQLKYNAPKAQMQRFAEGGLSPYLIYGQGNPGNASSPRPADYVPENTGRHMGDYMSAANFMEDIKAKKLNNALLGNEIARSHWRTISEGLGSVRKELDLLSDYPGYSNWQDYSKTRYTSRSAPQAGQVMDSYRRKLNEMKLALGKTALEKVQEQIRGMRSENVVKGVRAMYADEYGMVGGDWTQGLGLIKSLPSFFKSKAKGAVSMPKPQMRYKETPVWDKVNREYKFRLDPY